MLAVVTKAGTGLKRTALLTVATSLVVELCVVVVVMLALVVTGLLLPLKGVKPKLDELDAPEFNVDKVLNVSVPEAVVLVGAT
jgi:hypothetical protein